MRAISSAASISIHAAAAAAFLLGTKSGRTNPVHNEPPIKIVFPQPARLNTGSGVGVELPTPGGGIPTTLDLGSIALPSSLNQSGALTHSTFSTDWASKSGVGGGEPTGWGATFGTSAPEILSGPLPVYPNPLRQAGIEGQVVLEARVDSTGRVQRSSISVVSASHPGFVEPARQALVVTLFRPARVNGRAVPTLIRVPFAFSIRGGTGRAP
ncbi:MAG TPA: energy transducer TonB [Gemmatimonadales bacterium]|nr:energy transducer TonB [Gemmatimonadales bacterium]